MKLQLFITCALWCLCQNTAYGACDGNSSPSNTFYAVGQYAPAGARCCFPFTYDGISYDECTTQDYSRPWCSVDSMYTSQWGNCVTDPDAQEGQCSGDSSQSTVYRTTGGNAPTNTPCCFPFLYEGNWYDSCTTEDHIRPWCTVGTYYGEAQWGNCVSGNSDEPAGSCSGDSTQSAVYRTTGGNAPRNTPCCFPFFYQGTQYDSCTTEGHTRPWCTVGTYYGEAQWGNCVSGNSDEPEGSCSGDSTRSAVYRTTGGNAPRNTPCCFPFFYQGTQYDSCTTEGHTRPWCSVGTYYGESQWGNCVPNN